MESSATHEFACAGWEIRRGWRARLRTEEPHSAHVGHLVPLQGIVIDRSAVAYNALGIGLLRLGHVVPAVENFERALAISPDCVDAHNNVAAALMEQGRIEEALEHARQALVLDPSSAISRSTYLLGLHYSPNYSPSLIHAEHGQFA